VVCGLYSGVEGLGARVRVPGCSVFRSGSAFHGLALPFVAPGCYIEMQCFAISLWSRH